ncbi:unnamed protein product [Adineta ricciae]|uniref:SMP-30/Gluconolactonase/LRE-like region domain-containing protein n=1 Tax=Adineta ricciae TaxID=249248 RepID=A0A814S1B4_ADIRI|nr:unnamed protein product [Adineta ricciae]CAF1526899.1 unnamed protein product [Adineta ricciae]
MQSTKDCFVFALLSFIVGINSQLCHSATPYERCSANSACGCFPVIDAQNTGACAFLWKSCSQLVPCGPSQECSQPDHICVHHRRCSNSPVCYPMSMVNENICPPISNGTNETTTIIPPDTTTKRVQFKRWKQNATTVAGGHGQGDEFNQLDHPEGISIDQNKNIFIADTLNHRIMKWKPNETEGTIVADRSGEENRAEEVRHPNVIILGQNNSPIIADWGGKRVIQWFNQTHQEILIENIACSGLAIDKYGFLYASDSRQNQSWRGDQLNQLNGPTNIFVDDEQSVYITDSSNHRVMKWRKDANEGVIVAGGNREGKNRNQLDYPRGLFVDDYGQVYVADCNNRRVMRWKEGAKVGEIVVGGNGYGSQSNQFFNPMDLSFDSEGNLYVADTFNHRVQKFDLISQ